MKKTCKNTLSPHSACRNELSLPLPNYNSYFSLVKPPVFTYRNGNVRQRSVEGYFMNAVRSGEKVKQRFIVYLRTAKTIKLRRFSKTMTHKWDFVHHVDQNLFWKQGEFAFSDVYNHSKSHTYAQ